MVIKVIIEWIKQRKIINSKTHTHICTLYIHTLLIKCYSYVNVTLNYKNFTKRKDKL